MTPADTLNLKRNEPFGAVKPRKPITLKQFVVMQLRRCSYKWGPRNRALASARVSRGIYRCAMCPDTNLHPKKNIRLDHINPVVPVTGWDDWNGYIERMFCEAEGFQVICLDHHKAKTQTENAARKSLKLSPKGLFKKKNKKRRKSR